MILDANLEDRTLLSIPGVSVQGGVLTILGDQDSVGENDSVTLASETNPLFIDVTLNGVSESLPLVGLNPINKILVDGLGGSNSLTVDSTNGAITRPIQYQGSTITNSLTLTGGTAAAETIAAGPIAGSGTATLTFALSTETIQFQDQGSPIADSIAAPLEVDGTSASDYISLTEGSAADIGVISVNTSALVAFSGKSSLTIDTGSGNDVVDLNDPALTPLALTGGIAVNGGTGAVADTLVVHNSPTVADTLFITPSGAGAGVIDDDGLALGLPIAPEVTFSNIAGITAKGQAGLGDQLQYNGTTGDDTFEVVPGSTIDSGSILGSGGATTPFSFVPVTFFDYSGTGAGIFADSAFGVGPVGGDDTVLVDGTSGDDTFTLEDLLTIPGFFDPQIEVDTGAGARTPVFFDQASGVDNIAFRGLGGSDTYVANFSIINAFPGVGISVQGNGDDTLQYTSTIFATTNVNVNTSTITSTLANPVTYSNVGDIAINDLGGSASVVGTDGTGEMSFDPTGANAATVALPGIGESFSFSYVFLGLTLDPGPGTLTILGTSGDDVFDLAGVTDTTATVNVDGLLSANLDTSSALSVVVSGGAGDDTVLVDSSVNAFTSPVQFTGGGGMDQLLLNGGTATTDTYTAYATTSQSVLVFANGTETITVSGIYGILDAVTVAAGATGSLPTTDIIGTNANDTINYAEGIAPPSTVTTLIPSLPTANSDYGLVTVGASVALDFTNKGALGFEGAPGNDTFNIDNSSTPDGLTGIGIDGGTGINNLVINAFGMEGLVTTPGLLAITGQVPVVYTNIQAIQVLNVPVPPITTVPGVTFFGNAGVPLTSVIVAAFTQGPLGYPSAPGTSFTASINWGDGTPATPGTVVASPGGGYAVVGSHTYELAKTYSVVVTVEDNGSNPILTVGGVPISLQDNGSSTPTVLTATPAVINQSPLLVVGQPVTGRVGVPIPAGTVVGTFTDAGGAKPLAAYAATITYTIGTTPTTVPATIVFAPGSTSNFLVETPAPLTIPQVGVYSLQVGVAELTSSPPQTSGAETTVTITPAQYPLLVVGEPITGTSGVPIPAGTAVATFTDAGGAKPLADYAATITFMTGATPTTVPATIVLAPGSTSNFIVETPAAETIDTPGTYGIQVGVAELLSSPPQTAGANTTVTINPVPVIDYPIIATGAGGSITGHEDLPLTPGTVLATFTYSNPLGITGTFIGTVSWGDGSTSAFTSANLTTVGAADSSQTQILATSSSFTHTYVIPGSYQVVITINHPISPTALGSSAVVVDSVNVVDAPLSAAPISATAKVGTTFIGPIATFLDTAPNGALGDYIATINWGDGVVTTGAVSAGPVAGFVVTGSHVYSASGAYPVLVTIDDKYGASTSVVSTITVSAGTLAVAPATNHVVTAGQATTASFGSFTDTDPLALASDFAVTLNWGDGSTGAGTVTEDASKVFHVSGTHTYANPSLSTVIPVTFSVVDTSTTGGPTLTGAAGSDVVVADAPLSLFQGATVTSLQGISTGLVTLGTFTSTNPSAKASQFGAIIYWNDGTTSGGTVTSIGATPGGQTFSVKGTHTYIATGVHPITIEIVHAGGSSIAGTAQDIVTAAPLTSTGDVISATGGVAVSATVATFTDANPTSFSPTAYSATIDWGDGSPQSAGTIVANPSGGYSVVGSHVYSNVYGTGGLAAYTIQTTITDVGGATTTAIGAALTSYVATPLTGILDPTSDSGESSTDFVTNVSRPTFLGTAAPGSTVTIFAQPTSLATAPAPIATTVTGSTGAYTATVTTPLADGTYIITATATDSFGNTVGSATILPASTPLVIDTVAPVVSNVYFDRVPGQVDVTFQDALSGLDQASITNPANYSLTKKNTPAGTYLITGITASTPTANGSETVVLTFNGGAQIRGGYYNFTVLSGATGVQDVAGNSLDGVFFGTFPSGNGLPDSDFVAALDAIHHKVYAPATVIGSSTGIVTSPPTIIPTANPELSTSSVSTASVASKTVSAESTLRSTILGTTSDATTLATHDAALAQVKAKQVAKASRRK